MPKSTMFSGLALAGLFISGAFAASLTLRNISIEGLPETQKEDLMAHLGASGIGEGKQQLSEEGLRSAAEAITSSFADARLKVQIKSAGADQVDLVISAPVTPLRVGGNVMQANILQQTKPVYPPEAKADRIQGTVRFNVLIGRDGHVASLNVVSGPPELVESAMEAVRQWIYRPTLLNSTPVEVQTVIDVNYTLAQ